MGIETDNIFMHVQLRGRKKNTIKSVKDENDTMLTEATDIAGAFKGLRFL